MHIVVLVTASDKKEAGRIAQALVNERLAACVNVVGKIRSLFWWQGKVDKADEVLLVIKSKKSLLPQIIKTVKAAHSYEVPEIIALPIVAGEKKYLRWIDDSCRTASRYH
jgi:periplasmic divalent cation tolerance protein